MTNSETMLDEVQVMRDEQERLNTFLRWPDDIPALPVSTRLLAEAGFYRNRSDRVQTRCFSCGLCVDNWLDGDIPLDRHRLEMPDCPFLARDSVVNSVPTSDRTDNRVDEVYNRGSVVPLVEDGAQIVNHEGIAEDIPRELYQFEEVRIQSFIHWPIPDIVSPSALARSGFYSLNPNSNSFSDSVQCAFCEGAVGSWERGDCPDREHRRHFPLCPFVVATINPRLERLEGRVGANHQGQLAMDRAERSLNVHVVNGGGMRNLQELGVYTHTAPRKPRFTSLSARLASFTGWPTHLIQTPEVLAEAGFYYEHPTHSNNNSNAAGVVASDHVRCFHCDGGLKHWDPHDDPWTEHARWFPQCSYVLLMKGADFALQASRGGEGDDDSGRARVESNSRRSTMTATSNSSTTPSNSSPSSASNSHPNPPLPPITDRELQAHLQAPPALEALNLGIVVERVKQAIKEKLERTGNGFSSGAALIEAALNLQRDEDLDAREASGTSTGDTGVSNAFFQMLKDALDESTPPSQQTDPPVETVVNTEVVDTTPRSNMTLLNSKSNNTSAAKKCLTTAPSKDDKTSNLSSSTPSGVKLSLEEENRLLKEARLCKICMDSEVCIVFLPCGHLATCMQCAPNLQACPVCRSSIKATVRTFLS